MLKSLPVALFCLFHAITAQGAVVSTFDADLEGWRISGDNTSAWSLAGGNPDGCIFVNDLATGARNDAVAPPAYLGDWSAATSSDTLRFDVYSDLQTGSWSPGAYTFRISGPGGTATALAGYLPPEAVWVTVSVSLDPADWVIEAGSWSSILDQVTSLLLAAEYVNGDEDTRIDNVSLSIDPIQVFEPCAVETFAEGGYLDWTFASTGGVTSPATGGNRGGYLRVADGSGTSVAFAPARFLGDWSSLDGSGKITLDLRLISRATAPSDITEFLRIAGPGGVAVVPLAGAEIPASGLVWKTFEYPLEESTWTVVSGTWSALLSNVTECRIQVEYVDGSEVVGMDNFGRLADGCGVIDPGIVVEHEDFEACGYESFVGVDAIALNPDDDELYGLLDQSGSSGGGLYPLTGPGAGLRLQSYTEPNELLFTADGTAFLCLDSPGTIYRWDPVNGSTLWVSGFHAGDDDPGGMCFAPAGFDGPNVTTGEIIVSDFGYLGPDEFWSFSPTVAENERQMAADLPGDPDFRELTADPAGSVYTADTLDSNNVYRLLPDGALQPIALSMPIPEIVDLAFSTGEQRIFAVSNTTKTLNRIDPSDGTVEVIATGFVGLSYGSLEVDGSAGAVLVSDGLANRVYRVCPVVPVAVEGVPFAGPNETVIRGLSAWPNPASSSLTQVAFDLRREVPLEIAVYDLAGRLVRRLENGQGRIGPHALVWDHRNELGKRVASGVYLVRVRAGEDSRSIRTVILR